MPQANGWDPYRDDDGKWNWRVWSSGRVTASTTQGYENWDDMIGAALNVAQWIISADRAGLLDEPPE